MVALSLQSVSRRFGSVHAVDGFSLDVGEGEFICLLGPSGCGKSTALRMIAGFETPDQGDIAIDGASTLAVPPNRRATSMVFQSHALWSHMTVFGNIAFGLKLRRLPRATIAAEVAAALALVGLTGLENRHPRQLSGGQQQRVALARSLVLKPKILLLDEPFSSLDAHLRVRLRDELKAIQRRLRLTTIFVTHDQEEALTLADRIVVMNRGAIEQVGAPGEIYDQPRTLFAASFIGAMNLLPAQLVDGQLAAGPFRVAVEAAAPALARTDALHVAIRPEDIVARPDLDAPDAVGIIEQVLKLGPVRLAVIDFGDKGRLKIQDMGRTPLVEGTSMSVHLGRLLVYRGGADPIEIVRAPIDAAQPARRHDRPLAVGGRWP
jgi:putative spermidine/putrescine transport system ATP-binding protein